MPKKHANQLRHRLRFKVKNTTANKVYGPQGQVKGKSRLNDTIGVGVQQHPDTLLWQVWMSIDGFDLELVSAHRDQSRAEQAKDEILQAAALGHLSEGNQVIALLEHLRSMSDAEPTYFPESTVVDILARLNVQQATVNLERMPILCRCN
jgi:hypothetical protein